MSSSEKEFKQLLRKYERYIFNIIKKYPYEIREDLYQVGALSIFESAKTHDAAKASFSTYVYNRIRGAIGHYLRDCCQTVRVPRWLFEKGVKTETCELHPEHIEQLICNINYDDIYDVKHALNQMSVEEQKLLLLRFVHDMSYKEIASIMGVYTSKSSDVMTSRKVRQAIQRYKRKFGHTQDNIS